ncbi:hypothetical protein [Streptomyces sp. TLI_55]|uniref:hypothetical protein n=1 Tax=Streptomyces sp. TLI_55 TaxID=1938861 RepID=UPI00117F3034|nr:hypothetical protein [Streptomyces sp. TLI_55]
MALRAVPGVLPRCAVWPVVGGRSGVLLPVRVGGQGDAEGVGLFVDLLPVGREQGGGAVEAERVEERVPDVPPARAAELAAGLVTGLPDDLCVVVDGGEDGAVDADGGGGGQFFADQVGDEEQGTVEDLAPLLRRVLEEEFRQQKDEAGHPQL